MAGAGAAAGVHRVRGVHFAALGEEELRAAAAVRVVSPLAWDETGRAVPGGLYDPRMGPSERVDGRCKTCGLGYAQCPGHLGYLKLMMPLFNPLLAGSALYLLRGVCQHCHRFKAPESEVASILGAVRKRKGPGREPALGGGFADGDGVPAVGGTAGGRAPPDGLCGTQHNAEAACMQGSPMGMGGAGGIHRALQQLAAVKRCDHCGKHSAAIVKDPQDRFFLVRDGGQDFYAAEVARAVLRRVWRGPDGPHLAAAFQTVDLGPSCATFSRGMKGGEARKRHKWSGDPGADRFFTRVVAVQANRHRPFNRVNGVMVQNAHSVVLSKMIQINLEISKVWVEAEEGLAGGGGAPEGEPPLHRLADAADRDQHGVRLLSELQGHLHALLQGEGSEGSQVGLRNLLDKKEGLFRMNMMGKRINFAGRSVIAPDPFIKPSELGVPRNFAKKLSFPEHINAHNAKGLIRNVKNGALKYPGATAVAMGNRGTKNLVNLAPDNLEALSKLLLQKVSPAGGGEGGSTRLGESAGGISAAPGGGSGGLAHNNSAVVHRHVRNGDMVLINRQPTLHRPSIMGQRVRLLPPERTIRLHYTNCNCLNADFDGDELNLHVPQDFQSSAEAAGLMLSDRQYILPTDGKPARGLIQDHVVGGCKLSFIGSFFKREEYHMLVSRACGAAMDFPSSSDDGEGCQVSFSRPLPLQGPAILKPEALWTGKQVITTLLTFLTEGRGHPLNVAGKSRTKEAILGGGGESFEHLIQVRDGELISGVLDKGIYGNKGLVHAFQELYGDDLAGTLLSALSHLFSFLLQSKGFTVGVEDFMLTSGANAARKELLKEADQALEDATLLLIQKHMRFKEDQSEAGEGMVQRVRHLIQRLACMSEEAVMKEYDSKCMSALNVVSSKVIDSCLHQQVKKFPENCLSLMTDTGAKGSTVNSSQISVLLGQQALEGRRVPQMESLKTLPCFAPCDVAPRAHGYISDRYFNGLRPQEFYFHCMAGRDGLVDTTVKTARSGYLQRCLVKNLEALHVNYDGTVRGAGNDIVQFSYGDDGLDPVKHAYLGDFTFLARNSLQVSKKLNVGENPGSEDASCIPDKYKVGLQKYLDEDPDSVLRAGDSPTQKPHKKRQKVAKEVSKAEEAGTAAFEELMLEKYRDSRVSPGEAVGVLAAQSVGEPSTQMTLNTFHFAGRADANVTMGIPRLNEIFKSNASAGDKSAMFLPLRDTEKGQELSSSAMGLCSQLQNLRLGEIMKKMELAEAPFLREGSRSYLLRVTLFDIDEEYISRDQVTLGARKAVSKVNEVLTKSMKKLQLEMEANAGTGRRGRRETFFRPLTTPDDVKLQQLKSGTSFMLEFSTDSKAPKLVILEKVAETLAKLPLFDRGIGKATLSSAENGKPATVITSGYDLPKVWESSHTIDVNNIEITDVRAVLEHYGIEAARATIVKEVQKVFGAYGIEVEPRHLELIADYMTRTGDYTACNRTSINVEPSPIMKMSFETATSFLAKATLEGTGDFLTSPSGMIAVGQPARFGTGMIGIYQKLQ